MIQGQNAHTSSGQQHLEQNLHNFQNLINQYRYDTAALAQVYKVINYKPRYNKQ